MNRTSWLRQNNAILNKLFMSKYLVLETWGMEYCKTLIIRVTLFSRGHRPWYIHETLFSRISMSSSITLIIEIISEDFIWVILWQL